MKTKMTTLVLALFLAITASAQLKTKGEYKSKRPTTLPLSTKIPNTSSNKNVKQAYAKLIKDNGKALQTWAKKEAKAGKLSGNTPYGKFSGLKESDQHRLLLAVKVEEINLLEAQIAKLKESTALLRETKSRLKRALAQAELLESKVEKKESDSSNSIIGKI